MAISKTTLGTPNLSAFVSFDDAAAPTVLVNCVVDGPITATDAADIRAAVNAALVDARAVRVAKLRGVVSGLTRAEKDAVMAEAQK